MATSITAIFYISIAIVAAYVLRPRAVDNPGAVRALIFWFAAAPILFAIYSMAGALAAAGLLFLALAPRLSEDRAGYYLAALFATPINMRTEVPFPGINYLINLDFAKIAALLLLVPAIVSARRPVASRRAPAAGFFVFAFVALVSIQLFRTENITNGLRGSIDYFLLFAVPYMAIIRLAPGIERFDKVFSAFLTLGLVTASVAIVSEAIGWNFYNYLIERHGTGLFADSRGGILRVNVTTIPMLVGFSSALGLIGVGYFRGEKKLGVMSAWVYRGMLLAAALFTYSRGAWLAAGVGFATFYLFTRFPRGLRPLAIGAGAFLVAPAAAFYVLRSDLNRFDPYGTFEYRRELFEASLVQVRQHPLFGDPNFLTSGEFSHLVQGQGIVDIVNYYLQITLEHGLVGLALYFAAFLSVVIGLLQLGGHVRRAGDDALERQRAAMLSALAAFLVLIATVSGVSLIPHVGVALLGLGAALLAAAREKYAPAGGAR
jgi:O-antigen ligase